MTNDAGSGPGRLAAILFCALALATLAALAVIQKVRLDGVVLAPGRDIEPRRYGQEPGPSLAATEPERDAFELELVPRVLERGLPVLGMCRGIQVLNVALGGTLVQHLGDEAGRAFLAGAAERAPALGGQARALFSAWLRLIQ